MCYTLRAASMTARKQANVRLDDDILEGLQRLKERDGVPISEQVRRALREWLEMRGVMGAEKKTARRRAATHRRA
jgi:hypothetical protein